LASKYSTSLVTVPKFDRAKNIAFKHLIDHLRRMKTIDLASSGTDERNMKPRERL
jgi:hypothetical protein